MCKCARYSQPFIVLVMILMLNNWPRISSIIAGALLLVSHHAYAAEQDVTKNNVSLVEHVIVKNKFESSAISIDPVLSGLLERFRKQPDDLQLVADLNTHKGLLLNYVDVRLADTSSTITETEAMEWSAVLSLIKDVKATNAITTLGLRLINNTEMINYFLRLLRELPVTEAVQGYLAAIFKQYRGNTRVIRSALLYYITVQHESGMRWASYYRSPGINSDLRFAGLTLASVLVDDDQVTRWILDMLNAESAVPVYQHYYLLKGLHARISDEEFDYLLPRMNVSPVAVKEYQRVRDFNRAMGEGKNKLASFMLVSPHIDQQQEALKYYLRNKKIMDVWHNLSSHKRLSAVRLANMHGWALLPAIEQEVPLSSDTNSKILLVIIGLLIPILLFFMFRIRRRPFGT